MASDPIGAVVRNLFLLQRVGNGMARTVGQFLLELFDDIAAQLARIDPTAPSADRHRRQRVEKHLGAVEGSAEEVFAAMRKKIRQDLAEFGKIQADWAAEQLETVLGGVAVDIRPGRIGINLIKTILDTNPIHGRLLDEWFESEKDATVRRVAQQIRLAMAQNETIDDMVRRIRGRAVVREGRQVVFEGGVLSRSTRETEAIVRTAVNYVANEAHLRTYKENKEILLGYTYTATLDSRTTLICASLDGKFFRFGDPDAKRPPQHVNCRSVIVPEVNWEKLGIEPPEPGTRASMGGPVPATLNYEEWLRRQPEEVQDEILGPTRADLFRQGRVTLRDLVRTDGSVVTIEELRARTGPTGLPAWQREMVRLVRTREAARAILGELTVRHGKDPEFRLFKEVTELWTRKETFAVIRRRIAEAYITGEPDAGATAMLRAIARSAVEAPVLYRGMSIPADSDLPRRYAKGNIITLDISSFTSDPEIAREYARPKPGRPISVLMRLRGGAQALPIENLSFAWSEKEWLTHGKFRILNVVRRHRVIEIELEHLGVFDAQ